MRDRTHNCRRVRYCRISTALLVPAAQRFDHVGVQLPRQAGNLTAAGRLGTMTSGAGRNVYFRHAVFEDFSPRCYELPRRATDRRRVERSKMRRQGVYHGRTQRMSHVEHDIVGSPMLGEGSQLVFDIFRLLSGKAGYGIIAIEALR